VGEVISHASVAGCVTKQVFEFKRGVLVRTDDVCFV
jgi:hypothetical protein